MSFSAPLVLLALPVLAVLALGLRTAAASSGRAAAGFAEPALLPSVAPRRPGGRRWVPPGLALIAVALLIVALAGPRHPVTVTRGDGAVMLANDVSSSMAATDLVPSRLGAAERAARAFIATVPSSIRVGVLVFNARPLVLQSPTRDHALARDALSGLRADGHTAVGDAINSAVSTLRALRGAQGRRPPAAIVLISDGFSSQGADPLQAAAQSGADHIPIYTVTVGTPHGTISVPRGRGRATVPVPVAGGELVQIAARSGGRAFAAADTAGLRAVYQHLARQLGHVRVEHSLRGPFVVAALVLLAAGAVLSLLWFGRLA